MTGETTPTHRILLVDSSTAVRQALRWSFDDISRFEVVAEAASGQEAIAKTAVFAPNLIILDNDLPDIEGVVLLPQLKHHAPTACIIFLTLPHDNILKQKAIAAGGDAFVEKDAGWDVLLAVINRLIPNCQQHENL